MIERININHVYGRHAARKTIERSDCKVEILESGHELIQKPKRTYEIWSKGEEQYFVIPRHEPWVGDIDVDKLIEYSQRKDNKFVEVYDVGDECIVTEYLAEYVPLLFKSANWMYNYQTVGVFKKLYHETFSDFSVAYEFYRDVIQEMEKLNEACGVYFEDVCPNNIMFNYRTFDYRLIDVGALRAGKFEVDFPFTQLVYGDGANDMGFVNVDELTAGWRKSIPPMTTCVSTHNNLPYLKLAVKSVRKNSFFKNHPFIVHAENCTDGTNEWLENNREEYGLDVYYDIVDNSIGGGMNFIADKCETEYVNFIHADFYVAKDWDWGLLMAELKRNRRQMTFSYRVQPNVFNETPGTDRPGTVIVDSSVFGELHSNFEKEGFENWARNFSEANPGFEVRKAEGVSGLIKKELWDEIGGNDPLFAPASWEDADLFIRMQFAGVEFVCTADSVVYHFGARSSHFPTDDFSHSSNRQTESEKANLRKWIDKWGRYPVTDANQMWSTAGLEDRYEQLKKTNNLVKYSPNWQKNF